MSSNRTILENLLYGPNTTNSNNSNALNPHSNETNPVRARLQAKLAPPQNQTLNETVYNVTKPVGTRLQAPLNNTENLTVNGTVYQISSDDQLEAFLLAEIILKKLNGSMDATLGGDCDTQGNGINLYENKECYNYNGMDRPDWSARVSIDSCNLNTTILPAVMLAIADHFCNDVPNDYFDLVQLEETAIYTITFFAIAVFLISCVGACYWRRQNRENHEAYNYGHRQLDNGAVYQALSTGAAEEQREQTQAEARRQMGMI